MADKLSNLADKPLDLADKPSKLADKSINLADKYLGIEKSMEKLFRKVVYWTGIYESESSPYFCVKSNQQC
ncbi:hypothetical protein [Bacillus sp. FJAT-29937]|uniref:hypothetical protein n=1 Tax=Bacillus sp. FJAT-29937 TaxID=1720553 RepID=UPI001E379C9F|nr:hypothetical protein [Bacillus sp. FJAT-29937]